MRIRPLLDVLLRSVVLLGIDAVFVHLVSLPGDDDGLGTGLLAFATLAAVAASWALVDGLRQPTVRVVLVWAAVALVHSVVSVLVVDLSLGAQAVLDDLVDIGPTGFYLVFVPALVTGLPVSLARQHSSAH